MPKYRPTFAQNQLQKHGWEEGKGLGKSENGIKSAIKAKVKNNKGGLGHDAGTEFTFHWWDHIFNKAANTIEVVNDEENGEVEIKKNKNAKKIVPQLMYNKRPLPTSVTGKPLLYGTFVSAGVITSKDMDSGANTPEALSDASDSESEEELSTDLLDRTFKKTGLTGHKGARHGFKLSGKLKRIQEQEAKTVQNIKESNKETKSESDNETKSESENKRKSKSKLEKSKNIKDLQENDIETKNTSKSKKKKRKLKENRELSEEEEAAEPSEPKPKKKKKKRKQTEE